MLEFEIQQHESLISNLEKSSDSQREVSRKRHVELNLPNFRQRSFCLPEKARLLNYLRRLRSDLLNPKFCD